MLQAFYLYVAYVFTHMLQVFHLDIAYVLQWLHTYFSRVSDVCCKCFNCFERVLQMFPLDAEKIDLVLHCSSHLLQLLGPRCMRVGVEGARAVGAENRASTYRDGSRRETRSGAGRGAGTGHGATWDPT
jgi:hypothetical protein